MTWEQLIGKIREGLTESGTCLRVVGDLLAEEPGRSNRLTAKSARIALTSLALAVSDLHSAVEHMAIGLDAVVGAYHATRQTKEVKGD